eukprot:GFUD01014789.1.p1 GENE.GFUD01014789.1~~GFUD01014789.1.p1  ORF type:complete len:725 (+),score=179.26 GFUD01014789.1:275-2449(+)
MMTDKRKSCNVGSSDYRLNPYRKTNFVKKKKTKNLKLDQGKSIANNNKLKKEASENKRIILTLRAKENEFREKSKEYLSLCNEISVTREENIDLKNYLSNNKQLNIELVANNEDLKKNNLESLMAQNNDLANLKGSSELKMTAMQNEKDILNDEKVELLSLNAKLSEYVQNLEKEKENLATTNCDWEKNVEVLNIKLENTSKQLNAINVEKKDLQNENDKLLQQSNDEKYDLENVIKELEKVQENMLKDKTREVSFERELFEKLQNADRENKEKIKILGSNLKNAENRIKEQINLKDVHLKELEEVQEAKYEQGNIIRLLEEKIKRIEKDVKNLADENEMKEENLNSLRIDLIELEKDRGTLSAILFENKALKENCVILESNLQTLNECQGKISVLEHNLLKCKETINNKENRIEVITNERLDLKEEALILKSELSDKIQDMIKFKQEMEEKGNLIENLKKEKECEKSKNCELDAKIGSIRVENSELESKYLNISATVAELKHLLVVSNQKEIILDEQLISSNLNMQEKNEEMRIKEKEIEQQMNLHTIELEHSNVQLSRLQKNFNGRESTIHSLQGEKQTHQKQLKQMQLALKTSLQHIRGLRTIIEDSHNLPAPKFDEQTLSNLLHLNAPTERPKLSVLKLCLADLRQDVRELNMQLGDRSRGSTPTAYYERPADGTETPSFLDRFQDSTISPSHSSGTPSLHISSASSLDASPEHVVNKLR